MERHRRHRAASTSGRVAPLEGLMSDMVLGSTAYRPPRREYDYDPEYPPSSRDYYRDRSGERDHYPRREHDYDKYDDEYGRGQGRKPHSGARVIRAISGDPNSEFGHLPPGTYMMDKKGSSSGKSRKKRRGPANYLFGSRA
ncbi:hypothetical protein FRC07_007457 [Ceratobasidium sp. 392]|nr:hypothetical protein FRC07_007457 [Ceratobasidium sp. 392]